MTIRELCAAMKMRYPMNSSICYHVFFDSTEKTLTYNEMDYTNNLIDTPLVFLFVTHGGLKTRDLRGLIESKLIERGETYYMNGKTKIELF